MSNPSPQVDVLPTPQPKPTKQAWKQFLRETLETLGLAVFLFLVINILSARVRVDGSSMEPTLQNNEFVLVSRLSYKLSHPRRGDIIVFRPPMYPQENSLRRFLGLPNFSREYEDYIKRIIGLPGETVKIEGGQVIIDGLPLLETYIAAPPNYSGEWKVPQGYLFVMGDNRNNSADSHAWGYLPEENILGKALVVYWPFADWMVLKSTTEVLAAP